MKVLLKALTRLLKARLKVLLEVFIRLLKDSVPWFPGEPIVAPLLPSPAPRPKVIWCAFKMLSRCVQGPYKVLIRILKVL